jgi:hypothetical protein
MVCFRGREGDCQLALSVGVPTSRHSLQADSIILSINRPWQIATMHCTVAAPRQNSDRHYTLRLLCISGSYKNVQRYCTGWFWCSFVAGTEDCVVGNLIACTVYCVLRTVYCVLCTVFCAQCTVYCVLCTVFCAPCTVFCVPCTVHCTLYYILCTVYCVLSIVHCVLCTLYCALCSMNCVLCTVYCALCPM